MKTSELHGSALDWAVAKAIGEYKPVAVPPYSTDWSFGGPLIEREKIDTAYLIASGLWYAVADTTEEKHEQYGPTPLVAAMRCYVSSKLGDDVEIPEGL